MSEHLHASDFQHQEWTPPISWFQSRAYWREVARRLPDNPSALISAMQRVNARLDPQQISRSEIYVLAWKDLLQKGLAAVQEVLLSPDDDHSQALRTTCPIHGLLSPAERAQLFFQVAQEVRKARGVP